MSHLALFISMHFQEHFGDLHIYVYNYIYCISGYSVLARFAKRRKLFLFLCKFGFAIIKVLLIVVFTYKTQF